MLLATVRLDPEAVTLAETFRRLPDVIFEAERIAAHSTTRTMPCLWATHDDFDAVDAAMEADPSVETIVESRAFDLEKYYHVEWSAAVERRFDAYLDKQASLLSARGTADGWRVRIRFVHREQFEAFRETVREEGQSFNLLTLTHPDASHQSVGALTPEQRDALVAATEHGYYDVPREATIEDLADHLDKSHQTVSELLRRGTKKLCDELLITAETGPTSGS